METEDENKTDYLKIYLIFCLTIFLFSLSAIIGPFMFDYIGYTVDGINNTSLGTISAFDATEIFANVLLAALIGFLSFELTDNKRP
ncbi:hypothetical protein [Methanosarcina soligelidi]|uniref:hypothetical protein n=1 Tax=Methanosarcina soligelidi TaxID=1036677 RepID=UPI00126851C3|nr:hypothetical protein [Methanosarcina soligelidi]